MKQRCVFRQFIAINDDQTCESWGFYMKWTQVNHDREEGKKEGERDRERFGESGRATQQLEKMALVDFDHWSKSTTPVNLNDTWEFLEGVNHLEQWRDNCQSIFGVASNIPHLIWLNIIHSNNTRSTTSL